MTPARIGILISGGGRTALNIHAACADGRLDAQVAIVVAHREDAAGDAGRGAVLGAEGGAARGAELAGGGFATAGA